MSATSMAFRSRPARPCEDMATRQSTVDYIVDQAKSANRVSARKMFGEYALYSGDTLVALICDDTLFVKPTQEGRAHIGPVVEAPAYKGAKPSFKIDEDRIDDADWLAELLRLTAAALPPPLPKKRKRQKRP